MRRPEGLFVHIPLDKVVTGPGDWTHYLNCFYNYFLDDPAVSGLELSINWDQISLDSDPTHDNWSYLTTAFNAVEAWNRHKPSGEPDKQIQLIVVPGFYTPQWVLKKLNLCDAIFTGSYPERCEAVSIRGYTEGGNTNEIWPLPWSGTYQRYWNAFLYELAQQFGSNKYLASVALGGPTGTSDEMYVPHFNGAGDGGPSTFGQQTQFYDDFPHQPVAFSVNGVMELLIDNEANFDSSVTPDTDEIFVTQWGNTVADYAKYFSDVTLIMTPAQGGCFPDLSDVASTVPAPDRPMYRAVCHGDSTMSCATTTEIMESFLETPLPSGLVKGVRTSGLYAKTYTDWGIYGVHWITENAATDSAGPVVGGAQFAHPYSGERGGICSIHLPDGGKELCPVAAAEFDVVGAAFEDTAEGGYYLRRTGSANINFLQIYYEDFIYAATHACEPEAIYNDGGVVGYQSVQAIFNEARYQMGLVSVPPGPAMSEPSPDAGACMPAPQCTPPVQSCEVGGLCQ